MRLSLRNEIAAKISELLEQTNASHPPIDLQALANKLTVPISAQALPKDISGFLHRSGENALIVVNSNHAKTRQRFTIAHELGHLILDHKKDQVHVDKTFSIQFRATASSPDPEETQANFFAAALLMPEAMLLRDLEPYRASGTIDDSLLLELAERYGVSMQALIIRLNTLKVTLTLP